MSDEYLIDTPENVTFSCQVAGIGSRFLAALVDSTVIIVVILVIYLTSYALLFSTLADLIDERLAAWIMAVSILGVFAVLWGYYIFFEMAWDGQSLGKRWVGLRVIRINGYPLSFVDSAIRNVVRLVDFLPVYYGLGVAVMFANGQARRLGDFAAGTIVVKERQDVPLESLMPVEPVAGRPAGFAPGRLDVERLTDEDRDLVRSYFARRDKLANSQALAATIAAAIRARLAMEPANPGPDDEAFLSQVLDEVSAGWRRTGPGR